MNELDWREMRARLVAQEQESGTPAASNGSYAGSYAYETPLIEQGSILMGGTKQVFGFALRQQFFHKSVMLLLQHDETFTKGIILNRPSAIEQDGWRLWCGHGQVAEGGIFLGADKARGQLEINALHALEGFLVDQVRIATDERGLRLMAIDGRRPAIDQVSTRVIKGVSYCSLDSAKALVMAGVAKRSDFWVCVGYSGWAPGQLQMELEQRGSWYLAAADSGTLLKEMLREARELPPPGDDSMVNESNVGSITGIGTWASLMTSIGREEDVRP